MPIKFLSSYKNFEVNIGSETELNFKTVISKKKVKPVFTTLDTARNTAKKSGELYGDDILPRLASDGARFLRVCYQLESMAAVSQYWLEFFGYNIYCHVHKYS